MKTIGLIGGTSWISTVDYYKLINKFTNDQLGASNAAQIILYSINFQQFKNMLDLNDWDSISKLFIEIAVKLRDAGAACIVLGANTPHLIADDVQKAVNLPLLHIAEAAAEAINKEKISKVLLLGTKFVMENSFLQDKLSRYGIQTTVPEEEDRAFIHDSIFAELTKAVFTEATKSRYLEIIDKEINKGAGGIIYACTEIPQLLQDKKVKVKTFDTTEIHARAVVAFATEN